MEQYIGRILNDRYEILEVLGVGGMAVVYKAKCHRLGRMVAVKILKPELAADPEIRSRFHDESKAVGMMSHPNIVNVYDVNQDGDTDYFVMELVDGITLKQYIKKRGGVLNWREALHFSVQILQGLSHAHSRGIIHRDIKPQNIMVLRDGSVKVADFGIARIADSQKTMTQEALGSVHYISPEQARGSDIDQRSDLYSVGVVLYEMLTGRLPYEGDSPVAVAVQHINSIPLAPRELNPEIPVGMEQITMRAMAQDRELRYPNAEAMLADLDAFRRNPSMVFDYQNLWMLTELKEVPAYDEGGEEEPVIPEEEEEDEEEEGGSRRTLLLIIGVVVVILLVIGFIFRMLWASLFSGLLDTGTEYTVPDLKGLTYAEAEETILTDQSLNGHFTITVSEETAYNAEYEPGEILYQDPEGGTTTKSEQTEITVILCAEEKEEASQLVMPNIIGKDYAVWADTLSEKYNVVVKYMQEYSSDYKEGEIISTDPVAGSVLQEGQTVTITYSKGEKITTVTMVSLIGMTENEAKSALKELGLKCGSVVTVTSDKTKGTVVFQSVNSGDEVELGTEVDLQISTGPQPEDEEEPEDTEDQDDQQNDNQQDDSQQDDQNGDSQMESDTTHSIIVYLPEDRTEDANISIKVNGVNFYAGTVGPEKSQFTTEYNGSITSIEVTLDGEDYHEYDVQ